MTRAPAALATWTTISPTPPTPFTTAGWSGATPASRTACTAVMPAQLSSAASSKETSSGRATRFWAGTAMRSENVPFKVKPSWPVGICADLVVATAAPLAAAAADHVADGDALARCYP